MNKLIICGLLFSLLLSLNAQADSLEQYRQLALENNPSISLADIELQISRERGNSAGAWNDPTLSGGWGFLPISTKNGELTGKLGIQQMLPPFGVPGLKKKAARYQTTTSGYKYQDMVNQIEKQVTISYYDLYLLQQKAKYLKLQLDNLILLEEQMQTGFENDKVSLADLLQIQISRREMQQKYDDLLQMQRTAENNFNLFIGQAPGTELSLPDTLSFPNDDRTFSETDFSSHPLILALQAKEEVGNTFTRIKRREKLPRIGVGVEYSFIDKEGMGTDAGQDALMASMSLTIPWQRKALKAQVKEAELLSRQTRQELELKRLNLQLQYNRVRSELKATQNDYLTGISINGMLEQKLMLSKTAYENGEVGFDVVIQSENKFYMGLISTEEAKIKYISTSAEMDYLLKKGN